MSIKLIIFMAFIWIYPSVVYGAVYNRLAEEEAKANIAKREFLSPEVRGAYYYTQKPAQNPPGWLFCGNHEFNGHIYYGYIPAKSSNTNEKPTPAINPQKKLRQHHRRTHRRHHSRGIPECPLCNP